MSLPTVVDTRTGASLQIPKSTKATEPVDTPLSSFDTIDDSRFTPGTLLTERYRIVGRLGKGGMGEVYRADDLKLRQAVALKFLPESLTKDANRLERFHHEVRIARQVSHPNVCRVYDISEADDQHFLSMEYVDGEDLAAVLRRLGRPSEDKALEIARQLCAGLAAAHDKGVLHRDLKPHNVMIDGSGRVRITDFGLAGFAKDFTGAEVRVGTPAYMAPEQLSGKEVSVKSDIYSLGLVLFELFTGRRAFENTTSMESRHSRSTVTPTSMSSVVAGIDPAVERVILRCLETEPTARPSSALAVAAALPGGDPLAAALAAGETPDPAMVAAAGGVGGLKPAVAWSMLVAALLGLAAVVLCTTDTALYRRVPVEISLPDLSIQARDLLTQLGYTDQPVHRAFGFEPNQPYLTHVGENDRTATRWDDLATSRPSVVLFWYRFSPHYLKPSNLHGARVTRSDPPQTASGSGTVWLNPEGKLVQLEMIPPEAIPKEESAPAMNWSTLFTKAELDFALFAETEPLKSPPVPCGEFKAWKGSFPGSSEPQITVQAGALGNRATFFQIISPWNVPKDDTDETQSGAERLADTLGTLLFLVISVGALVLAQRNLRQGRGDRKGAFRLMAFLVVAWLVSWCLLVIQVQTTRFSELVQDLSNGQPLAHALLHGCFAWLMYIALEPYARRLWPSSLVSWSRVLAGRFRDPMVGRDVLVGALFAVILEALSYATRMAVSWLDIPPPAPNQAVLANASLAGIRECIGLLVGMLPSAVGIAMLPMVLLLVLRVLLRRTWLAAAAVISIAAVLGWVQVQASAEATTREASLAAAFLATVAAALLLLLLRYGLFAAMMCFLTLMVLNSFPTTFDFSTWFAGSSFFAIGVMTAIVVYGFYISLAGRPLFKDELLEA